VGKGLLPSKELAHWRPPPVGHEEPRPGADEIVSFPAHLFRLGLLNEWGLELQHLNPNGVLHIAGFVTLCEGFLEIDLHAYMFRAFFYERGLSVKWDEELASVGGFAMQKRGGQSGELPAYTLAESNWGWCE
jgi:hypothetical protein